MLKGNVAPTIYTEGSLGDIYKNETTGQLYLCTMAYDDTRNKKSEYEWRILDEDEVVEYESKKPYSEPVIKNVEEEISEVEDVKKESKHTDYTSYSKKNGKR